MSVDLAAAMKLGMRRLVSGVSVITALGPQGEKFAMTASSVTSLSPSPPSLLVCVNRDARLAAILAPGLGFAVNILKTSHQEIAQVCASGEQSGARFNHDLWRETDSGAPYIHDAEVIFQCEVAQLIHYGTHIIVIGNILAVDAPTEEIEPLLYVNGRYTRLVE